LHGAKYGVNIMVLLCRYISLLHCCVTAVCDAMPWNGRE